MRYLLFASFLLSLISCTTEKEKNELQERNLNGPVEKVIINYFDATEKFGEIQIGERSSIGNYSLLFNREGYLKEFKSFNADGGLDSRTVIEYSEDWKRIGGKTYNSGGELTQYDKISYSDDGLSSEIKTYDAITKEIDQRQANKLDLDGNAIEEIYFDENDDTISVVKYWYKNGSLVKDERKELKYRTFSTTTIYKYDENNRNIEQSSNDSNDNEATYTTEYIEFDEYQNWTKKVTYENGKASSITTRKVEYYQMK